MDLWAVGIIMITVLETAVVVRLRSRPPPEVCALDKNSNSKDKDSKPLRITSNVRQNLQFIKLLRELRQQKLGIPKPTTSYRKKKVEKEELPIDDELYEDPATTLYPINDGFELAVPVLLVDGYNMCGSWAKLKKHFCGGRLEVARQKLIDELIVFGTIKGVKVVVVFDATMSGLPTHKETFACVDIVFSASTCADAWIEKEVLSLREDGCPKIWVATSDSCQQQAAHGAGAYVWSCKALISEGAYVWSCKALISEINDSKREFEQLLLEQRPYSMQGRLLEHNLDPKVVNALRDLKRKLAQS